MTPKIIRELIYPRILAKPNHSHVIFEVIKAEDKPTTIKQSAIISNTVIL